jgi:glutathione S-transferase
MTITITAFEASPDRGRGLARDMRVRWALEEAGLPYDVRLLSFKAMKEPEHLARHPFGQIPTYEEGGLTLFETGSIILHIAGNHPGLLPEDPRARARAITWIISALSTIEPVVIEREAFMLMERDKPWFEERLPILDDRVRARLGQLSARLGDSEWLDGDFSAGDLMMVEVLLRPAAHMLLADYPNLTAYVARAQDRPAFQRAFADQYAAFVASQAAG